MARDPLTAELALDRLEAELAGELPAHVRAFATAYARATPIPPPPIAARRPASIAIARGALAWPELAPRALALLRVLVPIAIDDDPAVATARAAARTWAGYARLAAARDAAAHARLGCSARDALHRVHGAGPDDDALARAADPGADPLAVVAGWTEPDGANVDTRTVEHAWRVLAECHGVGAGTTVRIVPGAPGVRPRAFVVEPRREIEIAIDPRTLATPAGRFAALHELGHALAGAIVGALPRIVDEAAAAYVARLLEQPGPLAAPWVSPLAAAARASRRALAVALAAIERGDRPDWIARLARPPWALWHDPGAQASYAGAEPLAERWWEELGPSPPRGAFATALVVAVADIDRHTTW